MKILLEDSSEITLQDIKAQTEDTSKTYYLSKENKEDNIQKVIEALEKVNKRAFHKKIKYSIDDSHYVFSLRVI